MPGRRDLSRPWRSVPIDARPRRDAVEEEEETVRRVRAGPEPTCSPSSTGHALAAIGIDLDGVRARIEGAPWSASDAALC